MKKTILPAIALATAGFFFSPFFLSAQTDITVQDDAKVGLIVTGTGNTINTTQIFGKSPEYAELKKRLDGLEAAIAKKAEKCGKYIDSVAKDDCRTELIALSAERDSMQKVETRFREDVIRLAEIFSKIELNSEQLQMMEIFPKIEFNSERWRLAKQFFDEGKIREADNALNAKEMQQEGDALLAQKERTQQMLKMTDSLLFIKADEFALKARLKATDYADSLRYDSAILYFKQSQRYAETLNNFRSFAYLLWKDKQSQKAIPYYECAITLANNESDEAGLAMMLGNVYSDIQRMGEAEKMYLRALEIYERLAKANPVQFEPNLATTAMNLGVFYKAVRKMAEAEKMYLRSLDIYERLAKGNPMRLEPDLARTAMNLGNFYSDVQKMGESEKMYLRALEIYERLAKGNPMQFEPDLARTCVNFGNFYYTVRKMAEAEKMYLRSFEIRERLAKSNPVQFEPDLARTCVNLGNFYHMNQKMAEAEKMYLRSLDIYERLAKGNPMQFEPDLARTCGNLSWFYLFAYKYPESAAAAEKGLSLDPALNWMRTNLGHSHLLRGDWEKAKTVYEEYLKNEPHPDEGKKALLQDWDYFEKAGVTHPNMEKARNWVKE